MGLWGMRRLAPMSKMLKRLATRTSCLANELECRYDGGGVGERRRLQSYCGVREYACCRILSSERR